MSLAATKVALTIAKVLENDSLKFLELYLVVAIERNRWNKLDIRSKLRDVWDIIHCL